MALGNNTHWQGLRERTGYFASACLDVGRADEGGAREVELRWAERARELTGQGAPDAVVKLLGRAVSNPTMRAGRTGRLVVAACDDADGSAMEIVLDETLPEPPAREQALWGPAPLLLPALRADSRVTPYLLVRLDRAGADLELHGHRDDEVRVEQVDGSHDVLHKIPGGGWSHLRMQHRVEDSWDHNAGDVAARVDQLVVRHRPHAVLLAGDEKAAARFRDRLGPEASTLLVTLASGGRAAGTDEGVLDAEVATVLDGVRRRRRGALAQRWEQESGRGEAAVAGVASVVDALRRGQVEAVLLHDDPTSPLTLWVGDSPLQVGTTQDEVLAMGASRVWRTRADAALVWAAVCSDADVVLVEDGEAPAREGIGAVLRWADRSTPRDAVPSMPGHGQ